MEDARDVAELRRGFDRVHEEILAHVDPDSDVEFVTWKTKVDCRLRGNPTNSPEAGVGSEDPTQRTVYFHGSGRLDTTILDLDSLPVGKEVHGPAIVQSPVTTIVIDPGARATRTETASLVIETGAEGPDLSDLDDLDAIGRLP